jgi:hypothetical protein
MYRFGQTFIIAWSLSALLWQAPLFAADDADRPVAELPVTADEMARRLDAMLAAEWRVASVAPAAPASDAEFLRRVYLDLTGRIPTVPQVRAFLADNGDEGRAALIDALLETPEHAAHRANQWRRFLLPDGVDLAGFGGTAVFERWLREQFAANVSYDVFVTRLLLASGRVNEAGPVLYFTALQLKPEEIATSTARSFLGTRLDCAQCHDHPFDHWTQDEFWGYAAFFARISRPDAEMENVSSVLRVMDANKGEVTLPETETVVPPNYPFQIASIGAIRESVAPDGTTADDPSRRSQLASWMTSTENPYFARATVNRVWSQLFGRGFVDPVDDMGGHNAATLPRVLDELADYFTRSGFDLRQLTRAVTRTRAYQLSSAAESDDLMSELLFARMGIKVLSAEQLYDCLAVVTLESSDDADRARRDFLRKVRTSAGGSRDYEAGIPQALTLMNGARMARATDPAASGLLRSLEAPFYTDTDRVEMLFLATLSRQPGDTERASFTNHVAAATSDDARRQAYGDLLWALLNSAEFTLNH